MQRTAELIWVGTRDRVERASADKANGFLQTARVYL
jgi:hypothetical protein